MKRDLSKNQTLLERLSAKLGQQITHATLDLGDAVISIRREGLLDFFRLLKLDAELRFNFLSSLTVVDWLDSKEDRFEVVYHLMSTSYWHRLRVKVPVPEENPEVESITSLWAGANFLEREAWDMYGVKFKGHPDLRRILMYDEFIGHPLRKDYPVQGKQPRIPLRSPEVRNTAVDMHRADLVKINIKKSNGKVSGASAHG